MGLNLDLANVSFASLTKFDGFSPDPLEVAPEKTIQAWEQTPKPLQEALLLAKERIEAFHKNQFPKDFLINGVHGERLGRRWSPVEKAGIYVPGGRAAYPSTVLMNAIPAYVAGVNQTIMVSPANSQGELNQTVLAAAHITGINKVFRIGGAQAIGALAIGTESIPKVDVITGPGNIYVTLAKKNVYGKVGIDSLAGPSEILIIADQSAKLEHVASDMLAQSEHDPLASAILITTDKKLAEKNGYATPEMLNLMERLITKIPELLSGTEDKPSLLHGDLWSGNYIVDVSGNPWLIDPAVYYGHREADMAMTSLFGGFSNSFYSAYKSAYPVAPGYAEREPLYQLYHLLNHLNLFGTGYYGQVISILRRYAA